MVEHCNRSRNRSGVGVWHIDRAGAKLDLPRCCGNPREERNARGDVFRLVGDVLADIGFSEVQFVRKQEGLAVLSERDAPILLHGMDRHREETKIHAALPRAEIHWRQTVRRSRAQDKSKKSMSRNNRSINKLDL